VVTSPQVGVAQVCFRCGTFLTGESRLIDKRPFCVPCATRPDVDYLEAFRLRYWGKRDVWAWLVGVGSLSSVLLLVSHVIKGAFLLAASSLFSATVAVCFFLGLRWARPGLVVSLLVNGAVSYALTAGAAGAWDDAAAAGRATGAAIGGLVFPLLIVFMILEDTRNRLFFKLEIPRAKLQKAWELYANNATARAGFMLAILSVLVPPLGPIALLLSVVGLRRVDPTAHPPIGRKGQAIAGIVFSSLSTLTGVALFFYWWLDRKR
jgi:hypothetical protein